MADRDVVKISADTAIKCEQEAYEERSAHG
jgi:hypothetical protein